MNEPKSQKRVITYGTFDLFHIGHERLLRRAKEKNNYLIVAVATDEYNRQKGKKQVIQNEIERFNVIASLDYVDKVIFEKNIHPQWIDDYKKYKIDEIIMGSDHEGELDYLKRDFNLNVKYVPRTKNVSSTQIKLNLINTKVVITYGTFDFFHHGHRNLLDRAKQLGDVLVVGVSTDQFNTKKAKEASESFKTRLAKVRAYKSVDIAIAEESWNQKIVDLSKYSVDLFVIGDDWEGEFDFLSKYKVKVEYLPRTKGVSSTQIKQKLFEQLKESNLE